MTTPADTAPIPGTSTQVAHPGKATLRTAAAVLVIVVPTLIAAIPIINAELGQYLPHAWETWLVAAGAFLVALSSLVTRLMALPGVQALLAGIGLGTGVESETLVAEQRAGGAYELPEHGRRADRDGVPDGRDTPPAARPLTLDERNAAFAEDMTHAGAAEDAYAADHPGVEGHELWDQDADTIDRYEKRAGIV